MSCLSPLAPLKCLLTDLARTGIAGESRSRTGIERFQVDMVAYLDGQKGLRSMRDPVDRYGFHHFDYERRAHGASVGTVNYPLIFRLYGVGFIAAAHMRFVREEI